MGQGLPSDMRHPVHFDAMIIDVDQSVGSSGNKNPLARLSPY
jgi:hypothetical protein